MRRFKSTAALALATALVVALAACGNGDEEPEPTTTTTAPPVAPLTGLPDPEESSSTRSALWVKVGNQPSSSADGGARPQTGLEDADVVYEEVAEGGVTRFAAVYNSVVPERVGPVRSVRVMDADLVQSLLGIFAYSGGAQIPLDAIESVEGLLTVDETRAAGDAMERSPDRGAPNNLYVLGPQMFERGGEPMPPPPIFEFLDEDEEFGGEPVESFVVGFSAEPVTYRWDAEAGAWLRFLGEEPFTTTEGEQISATNVIIQFTHYPNDSEGITVGEGEAWVFTHGELVRGTWVREDAREPIRYLDAEGEVIALAPGRTWVALLPNANPVDVTPGPPPPETEAPEPADD